MRAHVHTQARNNALSTTISCLFLHFNTQSYAETSTHVLHNLAAKVSLPFCRLIFIIQASIYLAGPQRQRKKKHVSIPYCFREYTENMNQV